MSTKQIRTGQLPPETPSRALSTAGPHVSHRGAVATAPRNAGIVGASRAGRSAQDIAAEHSLSPERIRQIVAAAEQLERGTSEAIAYLGRRTRELLERQGWTTVQLVRVACTALPESERLLQVPGFGRKSLREVRRWLWLQTGDLSFKDCDIPEAAGKSRAPWRRVRAGG
jgi:hypothetical protein